MFHLIGYIFFNRADVFNVLGTAQASELCSRTHVEHVCGTMTSAQQHKDRLKMAINLVLRFYVRATESADICFRSKVRITNPRL